MYPGFLQRASGATPAVPRIYGVELTPRETILLEPVSNRVSRDFRLPVKIWGVAIHSGFLQRASGAIPAVPQTCGTGFHSTGIRPTGASFRQSVHRLSPASEKLSGCVTPRISPKGVWYHTRRCHRLVVRGLTPQETRLLG